MGFLVTMLLHSVWSKHPSSALPCISIMVDIDNHFVHGEKTSIPYGNDLRIHPCIVRILVPFNRNGDQERLLLTKTKRPVDLKVGLGRVGTLYSRSSKTSMQHILTYLPSYCKNNICGELVIYAEMVTYIHLYGTTWVRVPSALCVLSLMSD